MTIRCVLTACCIFLPSLGAMAQMSGYMSTAYMHHDNPLYNYENSSDRLSESYLEVRYEREFAASMLTFGYVSGLMIFNNFTDRNYYEHTLTGTYTKKFLNESSASVPTAYEDEAQSDQNGLDDSTDAYLSFGLTAGARHDKEVYKEFDNFGTGLSISYRFVMNDRLFARISNLFAYRRYAYIPELSNITEALRLDLGNRSSSMTAYGIRIGGGFKHYVSSIYDTTQFEQRRSFNLTNPGKGKGGAALRVPSSKKLLISPGVNVTYQLSATVYFSKKWDGTSFDAEITYRYNPTSTTRYLAQYVNSSILSEDIYNDHFSYQGPEGRLTYKQDLLFGITSTWLLDLQWKTFGAPAFNLDGEVIGSKRRDLRAGTDLTLSRNVNLSDGASLEISLLAALLRNQSNDMYNDFSSFSIAIALGIGF